MLVLIVFPIADLRPFTPGAPLLARPTWDEVDEVKSEFLRSFGSVQRRGSLPDPAFDDGNYYAVADRTLHVFDEMSAVNGKRSLRVAYRRVYVARKNPSVVRVEVGLVNRTRIEQPLS